MGGSQSPEGSWLRAQLMEKVDAVILEDPLAKKRQGDRANLLGRPSSPPTSYVGTWASQDGPAWCSPRARATAWMATCAAGLELLLPPALILGAAESWTCAGGGA